MISPWARALERLKNFEIGWWVLYLLLLTTVLGFVVQGVRRWSDREIGKPITTVRPVGYFVVSALASGLIVLATLSGGMVDTRLTPLDTLQQVIRLSTLVAAFVVTVGVLIASLPVILDALERRGFSSFVAARHIRATKSGFLTVISVLSMLGVGVQACALCSVTSIMGGFGHDLKRKILGNTAHVVVDVTKPGGFEDYEPVLAEFRAAAAAQGGAATPVVGGEAMASSATNTAGTLMRGIDPDTIGDVISLKDNIEVGQWQYLLEPDRLLNLPQEEIIGRGPQGQPYYKGPSYRYESDIDPEVRDALSPFRKKLPGIILGRELAKSLHVMVGDQLTMLSPMGELGPTGIMPRARKFRVAAIFYSGMYEYDASHAYVLLDVGQRFFSMEDRITNVDVKVPDPERVGEVRPAVDGVVVAFNKRIEGDGEHLPLRARDWKEMNKNLFSALKLEKIATFIILSIAIAVASFCIICTLLLMVTEKSKEIAVLKALGAADAAVMRVFMLEGVLIGAIGTVFGVVSALVVCLGLSWIGVRLDPDVYYIDRLPVNVDPVDYAMVTLAALVICTLATLYPAYTASKVRPVEGIRYE